MRPDSLLAATRDELVAAITRRYFFRRGSLSLASAALAWLLQGERTAVAADPAAGGGGASFFLQALSTGMAIRARAKTVLVMRIEILAAQSGGIVRTWPG